MSSFYLRCRSHDFWCVQLAKYQRKSNNSIEKLVCDRVHSGVSKIQQFPMEMCNLDGARQLYYDAVQGLIRNESVPMRATLTVFIRASIAKATAMIVQASQGGPAESRVAHAFSLLAAQVSLKSRKTRKED